MKKDAEALALGVLTWAGAVGAVGVLGTTSRPVLLLVGTLAVLAPGMALLTRIHLRDVPAPEAARRGARFGGMVLISHLLLDVPFWIGVFFLEFPRTTEDSRRWMIVFTPLIYFLLLTVPIAVGRKREATPEPRPSADPHRPASL